MTIVKKMFPYILIVGLVCWAFGVAYTGITIIHQKSIDYGTYQWTYFEFDVKSWLQSLEHSIADSNFLEIAPTTPELPKAPNWADIISILKWAFNSFFIFVANCFIYALNWTLLGALKLLLYPMQILFSIFGINTVNQGWMKLFNFLYSFEIPQIKPI